MRKRVRSRAAVLWCVAIVLLAALPALLLPAGAGWITDNGNKYIIMRSLAEHGSTAIAAPAAELDPEGKFFPDGGFHFRRFDGAMRSIYPEYFPALSLPFYRLFGERGVLVLPALGAMAAALLFGAWRRRMAAGLILLAGTPLLFYGGTFWEMAPSVLFALTAVMLAVRRKLFLAGLVLGAGLILREEMYFLAAALGVGVLFAEPRRWRGVFRFGIGFLVAALPLLFWQYHCYGHVLGLHGALYYSHNRVAPPTVWEQLSGFFEGCYLYLFQFNAGAPEFRWYYPVLFSPMLLMVAAGAAPGFGAWRNFKHGAFALASAAWLVLVVMLWRNPAPAMAAGGDGGALHRHAADGGVSAELAAAASECGTLLAAARGAGGGLSSADAAAADPERHRHHLGAAPLSLRDAGAAAAELRRVAQAAQCGDSAVARGGRPRAGGAVRPAFPAGAGAGAGVFARH